MQLTQVRRQFEGKSFTEPLTSLKAFTSARIALGRTGTSVPLKESLSFKLAHANARDAVYSTIDLKAIGNDLKLLQGEYIVLKSKAANRQEYLKRPDLGKHLNKESREQLKEYPSKGFDVAVVIADGLSATAINENAVPLIKQLIPKLRKAGYAVAPVTVAEQARVAIADEIGVLLKAKLTIILIGERPGLSSCNSLGAYLTFSPRKSLTDEARNCISNIRSEGLDHISACDKIFYLVQQSFKRKLSGVRLKEEVELLNS